MWRLYNPTNIKFLQVLPVIDGMVGRTTIQGKSFDGWSRKLFFAGGLLVLGSTLNLSVVFINDGYRPDLVSASLLFLGYITALAGTGALYPRLSDRSRLARLSLGAAGAGIVIFAVMLVWALAMFAGIAPDPKPFIAIPALALLLLGFVLFIATILLTDVYSSIIGLLLLGFIGTIFGVFAATRWIYGGDSPDAFVAGMQTVEALFLLAIWYRLREETEAIARTAATADSPA